MATDMRHKIADVIAENLLDKFHQVVVTQSETTSGCPLIEMNFVDGATAYNITITRTKRKKS